MKKTNLQASNYNADLDQYSKQVLFPEQLSKAISTLQAVGMPNDYTVKQKAASICEELKEQRKRHNLTQTELASKIDMKKEFISRIENGKADIQLSTFLKILDGLGLKMNIQ
ncbi:helix-turn-helix transcriptional regulator [Emticicia oligotrophica]|uniref:helix-turn-helix domain-containing protein n=1 Tax=Emticicia oligotrophica TaxID=312279 RepID=UPI00273AB796|nr:helix-turn-helix transcriptional regulator [Emticicia oligotrophica]